MLQDLKYVAGNMSYDVRLKIMLPGSNNILCRPPIDAIMLVYIQRVTLGKELQFCLDWHIGYWLAIIEDCTLPELSLGDGSAKFEPNSYLDP